MPRSPDLSVPRAHGVEARGQGHGIDSGLVLHVLRLALELGVSGVVVVMDAKPHAVAFHEALGFQALDGAREGLLVAEPRPMFLGVETVAAALEP